MKKILLLICLIPVFLFSQYKSGTITYVAIDVKKSTITDSIINTKERIADVKTLKFILNFDTISSEFYAIETVKLDENVSLYTKMISGVSRLYYNKLSENKIINYPLEKRKIGSHAIKSTNNIKWKLINEKRIINGYECYLARGFFKNYDIYRPDFNLEAWYCPAIPIAIGPKWYSGLPGLILELTDDRITFCVEKIDFDSKPLLKKLKKNKYKLMTDEQYSEYRLARAIKESKHI